MKYAFFDQPGWGHKGAPQLVSMADMMHMIVAARHGGSRMADPARWPSGRDPTKDPAGTWGGTWITQGDLAELQRLSGKKDTRSRLSKFGGLGRLVQKGLGFVSKIPVIGKVLPYAGGPLAPLVGTASLIHRPTEYIQGGLGLIKKTVGKGFF